MKGLLGQPQHHRRVLADRIQHDRSLELGDDFAHDVDALGFERAQVVVAAQRVFRLALRERLDRGRHLQHCPRYNKKARVPCGPGLSKSCPLQWFSGCSCSSTRPSARDLRGPWTTATRAGASRLDEHELKDL